MDLGRVVAFTDGVFAIAITLLVLNLDVPALARGERLAEELVDLWPHLFAYFLSFAVIGRFWIGHHRFFAALHGFDDRLVWLNMLYLSLVVLVPFTTELLGDYGDEPDAPVTYAAVLGAAALVNWAMIRHTLQAQHVRAEQRPMTEPFGSAGGLAIPLVFLASIPVAVVAPRAAELMWLLLVVVHPRSFLLRGALRLARRGSG